MSGKGAVGGLLQPRRLELGNKSDFLLAGCDARAPSEGAPIMALSREEGKELAGVGRLKWANQERAARHAERSGRFKWAERLAG